MFGINLKATILGLEVLFKNAGFTVPADPAVEPNALKSFIEQKVSTAELAAKDAAAVEFLTKLGITAAKDQTPLAAIQAAFTAKDSALTVYTEGLKNAGVAAKPAKEGAALTAEDIKTAVEARAAGKAAVIVAGAGLEAALPTPTTAAGEPATEAEYIKAIDAEKDNQKSWALFEAYQKKFGRR